MLCGFFLRSELRVDSHKRNAMHLFEALQRCRQTGLGSRRLMGIQLPAVHARTFPLRWRTPPAALQAARDLLGNGMVIVTIIADGHVYTVDEFARTIMR
jgi:hypothetical protein